MDADDYFPKHVVDQGRDILVELCHSLEAQPPKSLEEFYAHTHSATEHFNDLRSAFEDAGSELETAARESIGFDADVKELIATRDR